jgi:hypothetical protein
LATLEERKMQVLEIRKRMVERFAEIGIMAGTLAKTETYDREKAQWTNELCMVESVDWERIYRESSRAINVIILKDNKKMSVEKSDLFTIVAPMPHQNCLEYNSILMQQTNDSITAQKPKRRGS